MSRDKKHLNPLEFLKPSEKSNVLFHTVFSQDNNPNVVRGMHIIHSFIHFILPLTRNTTTVYRNTLKIIYNIPTKLFTRSNVVKARKAI